jgi:hypothetical protein
MYRLDHEGDKTQFADYGGDTFLRNVSYYNSYTT